MQRSHPTALALTLAALAAAACSPEAAGRGRTAGRAAIDSAALGRARAAADALGRDLMSLLTAELQRGGPGAAVAVCADSAQMRTARHSGDGLVVRRVGTRVRNPANTPDSLEWEVLRAYEEAIAAGRAPADTAFLATGSDGKRELRFLRPVRVVETCLTCHGPRSGQPDRVRALLAARYPRDRAVDYAVGDLRGAVTVRVRSP